MAHRALSRQPTVIRARRDIVSIVSDQLPGGAREARPDDLWNIQKCLAGVDPDLIILDLTLPITTGRELLRLLGETHPRVPVITRIESNISPEPRFFAVEPTDEGIALRPLARPPASAA
jgi:CheY-like chemotaxis protein